MFFITAGHIIQMSTVLGDIVFYNTSHMKVDDFNNFNLRLSIPLFPSLLCILLFYSSLDTCAFHPMKCFA